MKIIRISSSSKCLWPALLPSVFSLGWCGGQLSVLALVNGNLCQNILYYNRGIFNRLTQHSWESFSTALYISIKLILCDNEKRDCSCFFCRPIVVYSQSPELIHGDWGWFHSGFSLRYAHRTSLGVSVLSLILCST